MRPAHRPATAQSWSRLQVRNPNILFVLSPDPGRQDDAEGRSGDLIAALYEAGQDATRPSAGNSPILVPASGRERQHRVRGPDCRALRGCAEYEISSGLGT